MPQKSDSQWLPHPRFLGCAFINSSHASRLFKPISSPGIRVYEGPRWPPIPGDKGYKIWSDHSYLCSKTPTCDMEIFRLGKCCKTAMWKHPRWPNSAYCNKHKETLECFYPDNWSLLKNDPHR